MDFTEALNLKAEDIKRPPMLPVGHYRAVVAKIPEISTSDDGKWDFVDFQFKIVQAQDDVDADEMKEFGSLTNINRRHRFLFNKDPAEKQAFDRTLFQLKRFLLDHLKVDVGTEAPLKQMLDEAPNCQFLVTVGRRSDKIDKEIQYEDFKSTAPVE